MRDNGSQPAGQAVQAQHEYLTKALPFHDRQGGADAVVDKTRAHLAAGDHRWAAEVLNHVVFAEPGHDKARAMLADTYEQLGYGAENGTWRCAYLSAAHELRHGSFGTPATGVSAEMLAALTPVQLFDSMAIRVNGPRCWDEHLTIDIVLTDRAQRHRLTLRNGVLSHTTAAQPAAPQVTVSLTTADLPRLIAAGPGSADLAAEGDAAVLTRLFAALDDPDPDFAIVTP